MEKDKFISKVSDLAKANLSNENFGPEELAEKFGVSHSTLHRKIKAATGKTISQFIREIRLKKASEILLTENLTISEVAFKVGFGSATYFNRCFNDQFGCSPGEFKKHEQKKTRETKIPKNKSQKILLLYTIPILFFVLILLFLNDKYFFLRKDDHLKKSIAVRPFEYYGDSGKKHLAPAMRIDIIGQLSQISELIVMSPSSIPFNSEETDQKIGKRIGVTFILNGVLSVEENIMKLTLSLTNTKDGKIVWSEPYIKELNNFLEIRGLLAQTVAQSLNASITPEEKQRIEKLPTTDLTAFDFYQRGIDEFINYRNNTQNKEALTRAEVCYEKALQKDKTFAKAYAGLARVYWTKNYRKDYFSEDFLDSVLYWSEKALSFDNELDEAHLIRGLYYRENDKFNKALKDIRISIELNPNNWEAYEVLNQIYTWDDPNMVKALESGHQAISLNRGNELIRLYEKLAFTYACIDYFDEAQKYYTYAFDLSGENDSAKYFLILASLEQYNRNYLKADVYLKKALKSNTSDAALFRRLGGNYNLLRDFEESLFYYQKYFVIEQMIDRQDFGETHRMAQAYHETGNISKAEEYFNKQTKDCLNSIEKNRGFAKSNRAYYDLAAVYAFQGKKEEAYKNLDEFVKMNFFPSWWINLAKDDPLLDNLRSEKRFQEIISEMEQKFLREKEKAKNWLESNHILLQ